VSISAAQGQNTILIDGFETPFGTLVCGGLRSSLIDFSAEVEQFNFTAQAGDLISLTLVETSNWGGLGGSADARATLISPSGNEEVIFDSNSQETIVLPESGTYVVRVNANDLVSTGSYNLGLSCLLPASPPPVTLSCGGLESGLINTPGEVELFDFTAQAGDLISLTLVESSNDWGGLGGSADARATLFSPSGNEEVTFDSNSQETIVLPESGTYVVRVNANNLVSTGSYNLGLSCLLPASPPPVTLSCGGLESGLINDPGEIELFDFTAQSGDQITLTLAETSDWGGLGGSADARATLFRPSGLPEIITFDSPSQQTLTLPEESGTYMVRVNANNLVSTGSYNLSLSCLP